MKVVVVGTGYVGLVTGACFADLGHQVICVDNDRQKIESMKGGHLLIREPGLDQIVARNVAVARLKFSESLREAAAEAEVLFIAVGTPSRATDGRADRSFVFAAACGVATALRPGAVVAVKSTVPVGTGDEVEAAISELRRVMGMSADAQRISVVSNPEFLRAGSAVKEFMSPDRIVVGAEDDRSRAIMRRVYAPLRQEARLVFLSRRSSELTKYGANALLATKVAFINELADLCERSGADVDDVANAMGLDRRIGPLFLQAGPGFGGSCFHKDGLALAKMGEDHNVSMGIVEAVMASNECRKSKNLSRVRLAAGGSLRNETIGIWGLTFKADTDDIRDSPTIPLVTGLLDCGAAVRIFDPVACEAAKAMWPGRVVATADPLGAARNAGVLVVMTGWSVFKNVDLDQLREAMARPIIVDMRNLYHPDTMKNHGFRYHCVGRGYPACVDQVTVAKPLKRRAAKSERAIQRNGHRYGAPVHPLRMT